MNEKQQPSPEPQRQQQPEENVTPIFSEDQLRLLFFSLLRRQQERRKD